METQADKKFSRHQLEQIRLGKEAKIDTSYYENPEFNIMQMTQIRMGLEQKLDVSVYANPEYVSFQMEEIRKGLLNRVNVSLYASPQMSYEKMKQIRKGLQEGIDLTKYSSLPPAMLHVLRKSIHAKINIVPYIKEGYDAEQIEEILPALIRKIDIKPYILTTFRGVAIREIRIGLEMGIDVSLYANFEMDWRQMREIRLGLENRIDVSYYCNAYYNWRQMREIRKGLEQGLDVSSYASLMYTTKDMEKKRLELEEQKRLYCQSDTEMLPEVHELEADSEQIMVVLSEDEMSCEVVNMPEEAAITKDQIYQVLQKNGIVYGIDEDAVEYIASGKADKVEIIPIAKGSRPTEGKDGWYEYLFRQEVARTPKKLDDGTVDYQSVEWFEIVKKDQVIARYHEAGLGECGYTVTGKKIPALRGKEQKMLHGQGFYVEDGKNYIASMTGRIEMRDHEIVINSVYVFDEITRATGNVDLDGSVYIKGNVGSNTTIKATGDIVIDGFIESAVIESGTSVFLRQGMNAGKNGRVKAGENVAGKFFEGVIVEAKGDICCNYSMDAELYAGGKIILSGEKGSLIGGKASGRLGVSVYSAGNASALSTFIQIGVDEKIYAKLHSIEKKMEEIAKELKVLRTAYEEFCEKYEPEVRNNMRFFIKLEKAIYTKELEETNCTGQKKAIWEEIENAKNAKGIIKGKVYEGVTFEVNGLRWKAKTTSNITIKKVKDKISIYRN